MTAVSGNNGVSCNGKPHHFELVRYFQVAGLKKILNFKII